MKSLYLCLAVLIMLSAASCGGASTLDLLNEGPAAIDVVDDERQVSSVSEQWVTAWNANRNAFRFQSISQWNEGATFSSLYNGQNFGADAQSFAIAMAAAMQQPGLCSPASSSTLGLWYDSLGDDLE